MTSDEAYDKARVEGPRDDTRQAALRSPASSYYYAQYVDKCPRGDTRNAALNDRYYACRYALYVDMYWRVDTWSVSADVDDPLPFEYSLEWLTLNNTPATMVLV